MGRYILSTLCILRSTSCTPLSKARGMESIRSLTFKVARKEAELIAPAKPTPHEFKLLSDIDDQQCFRFNIPLINFYRRNPSAEGKDPVKVIRDAIGRALVSYYPFAGRLRERAGQKLEVECTGEGVVFIEADADVTLNQFGDALHPPFPCLQDLLYDSPASRDIINSPLLLIQVTRLKCGGFTFGLRMNHTMSDGEGIVQFKSAVGELSRGAQAPSVPPVWERHLLCARNPPRVTCTHHEYRVVPDAPTVPALEHMVHRSFFFGAAELSALRSILPPHARGCSNFDLLTACLWRCRTIAVSPQPDQEMAMWILVNCRRHFNPPLPSGYYGNVVATPAAIATAGDLSSKPLHYAVDLVRKAKSSVTEEYVRSLADLMAIRKRPFPTLIGAHVVSDLTRISFGQVDFGWGKPAYGGPAEVGPIPYPGILSNYLPFKNNKGEDGILLPMRLPANAMEVFAKELQSLFKAATHTDAVAAGYKTGMSIGFKG